MAKSKSRGAPKSTAAPRRSGRFATKETTPPKPPKQRIQLLLADPNQDCGSPEQTSHASNPDPDLGESEKEDTDLEKPPPVPPGILKATKIAANLYLDKKSRGEHLDLTLPEFIDQHIAGLAADKEDGLSEMETDSVDEEVDELDSSDSDDPESAGEYLNLIH